MNRYSSRIPHPRLILCWAACILLAAAANGDSLNYTNPVVARNFPDPSVIRVGSNYWATATSADRQPVFRILHSTNLVNWDRAGFVFQRRPQWTMGSLWAPEISACNGSYFIYYTGRQTNGRLAVAVATAPKHAGPYSDHGPMISQPDGSIDPVPFTDEEGNRFLIWKEDGNSQGLPTILWAQRLDATGLKLVGEPWELLRNDSLWEGPVVEGPFLLKRNGWLYLFYSGGVCCGPDCNYALGVARAKSLHGPWEKDPANPILAQNAAWKCPGHGSIVTDEQGRYWLLYHAYAPDHFQRGRLGMLDEVKFGADGWPTINGGHGPSIVAPTPSASP